ncbi:MAG: aminoacyl-tRNA deacylase [Thermoanaerobaculia bacterium]|nr:aminoacyl-tRNA deacylase [Thermoanaerobaculia bacterium]
MTAKTTTNATRVLDARKAAYSLRTFAAADFTAEEAAEKLGVPPGEVWKTLVAKGDRTGPLAAVIPTGTRLSLKKLARVSGNRTVAMVSPEEMERLTGYVKGGCSPFGMRKAMPLFVHEAAAPLPRLLCSAGQRGVQLEMSGADFLSVSGGTAADLVED